MSASLDPSALALIRRAQRAISRDYCLRSLSQYAGRDSFQSIATSVAHHYFPRAATRGNTQNLSDLTEIYAHVFVLGPLLYRLTGCYRPDWNIGTILSWFRRCMTVNTNQMKWSIFPVEFAYEPELIITALESIGLRRDQTFNNTVAEIFANLALSGGRKASIARLFVDPFLGHSVDSDVQQRFGVRSQAATRIKRRSRGLPVGSYLRLGHTGILLADPTSAKIAAWPRPWHDIRDEPLHLGDYILRWDSKAKRLNVILNDDAIMASFKEIKATMATQPTSYHKYRSAMRISDHFLDQHVYAIGSSYALKKYEKDVARLILRQVTSTAKNLEPPRDRHRVYSKLVLPITNPFLELNHERVSDATWLSFWNPYREWDWGVR